MTSISRRGRMVIQTKYTKTKVRNIRFLFQAGFQGSWLSSHSERCSIALTEKNARRWLSNRLLPGPWRVDLVSSSDVQVRVQKVDLQLKRRERIKAWKLSSFTPPHSTKIPLSQDISFTNFWQSTLNGRSVRRWLIRLAEEEKEVFELLAVSSEWAVTH